VEDSGYIKKLISELIIEFAEEEKKQVIKLIIENKKRKAIRQ